MPRVMVVEYVFKREENRNRQKCMLINMHINYLQKKMCLRSGFGETYRQLTVKSNMTLNRTVFNSRYFHYMYRGFSVN